MKNKFTFNFVALLLSAFAIPAHAATQNAINANNQAYTSSADGFVLGGGTTARTLTLTGADITLTGSGENTYNFPTPYSGTTVTLVGVDETQTLTHKTWAGNTITVPYGGTGATTLTGVIKGNGTSAMTAVTGTANYVARWEDANTLSTGILVDNGLNVGIGSTVPTYKLDVVGDINSSTEVRALTGKFNSIFNRRNGVEIISFSSTGNVGIGSTAPTAQLNLKNNGTNPFQITNAGAGDYVTVTSAGNVGIGTVNPVYKLQLMQPADNNGIRLYGYDDRITSYLDVSINSNGNTVFTVGNGGLFYNSSVSLSNNSYQSFGSSYQQYSLGYNSTNDYFRLYSNYVEGAYPASLVSGDVIRIYDGTDDPVIPFGNVGIGTTVPAALLDVAGDIGLRSSPSADTSASGTVAIMTVGETVAFGDLLYMKSDGKLWKSDADAAATMPVMAMAVAAISADAAGKVLLQGFVRNDAWDWTVGGVVYTSATAGASTQTAPSTTGQQVQSIGVATHADRMYFNPNYVLIQVQ